MEKQKMVRVVSRAEEAKLLDAQLERIKKDPAYGREIARRAGILDEKGQLTDFYKQK